MQFQYFPYMSNFVDEMFLQNSTFYAKVFKITIYEEGNTLQIVAHLDVQKLYNYKEKLITDEVVLTDERLYNHILLCHKKDYEQLKDYLQEIIEYPDYIIEDNRHINTMIYLKNIKQLGKYGRVVIKLALSQDNEHPKNSIITLMRLNDRTWKQTINNRGDFIWKRLDKNE